MALNQGHEKGGKKKSHRISSLSIPLPKCGDVIRCIIGAYPVGGTGCITVPNASSLAALDSVPRLRGPTIRIVASASSASGRTFFFAI